MRTSIGLVVAAAVGWSGALAAQAPAGPGDRVRVPSPDGAMLVGVVSSVTPESIVIDEDRGGYQVVLPIAAAADLERSLGRQRRFGRNFGLSIGISAAAFGVVSAMTWTPCNDTGFFACFLYPESRTEALGWGMAGGAIIGIPVGVIVGLAAKHERWEPVSVPGTSDATIRVVPVVGRGVGLAGSITFR